MQLLKLCTKFYLENSMLNITKRTICFSLTLAILFMTNIIHAQELSPLGKLAQDYVERLNTDLTGSSVFSSNDKASAVIVNPEIVSNDAVNESIDTISKNVELIGIEKEKIINEIKEAIKEDIDNSIVQIRKTTDKPAYELQKSIDSDRTELFENLTNEINKIKPFETNKTQSIQVNVDNTLLKIQKSLEEESGLGINFEKSKGNIKNNFIKFQEVLHEKNKIIESRQGNLVYQDSDDDGVSDYDEIYMYRTNPNNPQTIAENGMNDGEKILNSINPISDTNEKIMYIDPRDDKESFVSSSYRVEKIQLLKEDSEKIAFEGRAFPNTYLTLYIYNTPIIVTVKTDNNGQWSYQLDQEIENGEYQMFIASVGTSGKILARSNPILFTKTSDAAIIGISGNLNNSISTQNFLKDNFILIILAMLILVVVLGMMFVGNHKNIKSAVSELKDELNSKY